MKKKLMALWMSLLLVSNLVIMPETTSLYAEESTLIDNTIGDGIIRILEIQPSIHNELSGKEQLIADNLNVATEKVQIDSVTIAVFNAQRESINGKYDMIYFGNIPVVVEYKSFDGPPYYGPVYKGYRAKEFTLGNSSYLFNDTTYRSEVDITQRKSDEVQKFIQSGQLVYFDKSIFEDSEIKLTQNFAKYQVDQVDNVIVNQTDNENEHIQQLCSRYTNLQRKKIQVKVMGDVQLVENILTVPFIAYNPNDNEGNMIARLYMDVNGDGLYKEDEIVVMRRNVKNNMTLTCSGELPDGFSGEMSWKLEISEASNSAIKGYVTGRQYLQPEFPKEIKVLQIKPWGSGFSLNSSDMQELFHEVERDYQFSIKEISASNYNEACKQDPNYLITQRYDMVVVGFGDTYGSDSSLKEEGYNALKKFMDSGQSVMFTHDTINNAIQNDLYKFAKEFGQADLKSQTNAMLSPFYFVTNAMSKQAAQVNTGQITQYPFDLSGLNNELSIIDISETHPQFFKVNLENEDVVVWYVLQYDSPKNLQQNEVEKIYDPQDFYYTYSIGNLTFSGTGHATNGTVPLTERQLFVNTMIKATNSANHKPIIKFIDVEETIDLEDDFSKVNDSNNAQKILPDTSEFEFGIQLNDMDYDDEELYLQVGIYQERIGVNQFNRPISYYKLDRVNGELKIVEEKVENRDEQQSWIKVKRGEVNRLTIGEDTLKVFDIDEPIYIHVRAKDREDESTAIAEKMTAIAKTGLPLQVENNSDKDGYLVGDTINLITEIRQDVSNSSQVSQLELTTSGENLGKAIEISLIRGENYSYVGGSSNKQLQGENISNTYPVTWMGRYQFKPEEKGNYEFTSELNYMVDATNKGITVSGSKEVRVEKGILQLSFEDANGSGVKDVSVRIEKDGKLLDTVSSDKYGKYINEKLVLASGKYKITIIPPTGYKLQGSSTYEFELSYKQPSAKYDIQLGLGEAIENGKIELIQVSQGREKVINKLPITDLKFDRIEAEISFEVKTAINDIAIQVSVDNNYIKFREEIERVSCSQCNESEDSTHYNKHDKNLFAIEDGVITYSDTLDVGVYKIRVIVELPFNKITPLTIFTFESLTVDRSKARPTVIPISTSVNPIKAKLEIIPELLNIG